MSLKAGLGEAGFSLFDEWSRQSDKYNARDVRDTWRSIKPGGGITIGTLFFRAKAIGWRYNGERPTPGIYWRSPKPCANDFPSWTCLYALMMTSVRQATRD